MVQVTYGYTVHSHQGGQGVGENPVKYMMGHEQIILDAYQRTGGPKGAWEFLQKVLPELLEVMRYNTFKQYITPFTMIMGEVRQRLHKEQKAKAVLKETIKRLRQEKKMVEEQLRAFSAIFENLGSCGHGPIVGKAISIVVLAIV